MCCGEFQFTPPHEGRQVPRTGAAVVTVSIHAPARGATGRDHHGDAHMDVSIHAPARGATAADGRVLDRAGSFNSRPRTRGDPPSDLSLLPQDRFNSRPRTRGDMATVSYVSSARRFQFTPPHEGRRRHVSRTGDAVRVSIHAPARGATITGTNAHGGRRVSIHAPARGATPLSYLPAAQPLAATFSRTSLPDALHVRLPSALATVTPPSPCTCRARESPTVGMFTRRSRA